MELTDKKQIDIVLGGKTFKATIPTLKSMGDLYDALEKGTIKQIDFSLQFLHKALSPLNPEITVEALENYITVDMAEDIAKAFETLGINKKK